MDGWLRHRVASTGADFGKIAGSTGIFGRLPWEIDGPKVISRNGLVTLLNPVTRIKAC